MKPWVDKYSLSRLRLSRADEMLNGRMWDSNDGFRVFLSVKKGGAEIKGKMYF